MVLMVCRSLPDFSTNALSLVNRGFVYGIAHVREGKGRGYRWYKDGKRETKINTLLTSLLEESISPAKNLPRAGASSPMAEAPVAC